MTVILGAFWVECVPSISSSQFSFKVDTLYSLVIIKELNLLLFNAAVSDLPRA